MFRNYFLDASKGEGSVSDKYHKMDYLRVWDVLDLNFVEYPESGYTWIIDPISHWDDDFFTVLENRVIFQEREKDGRLAYYRKYVLQFLNEGTYQIAFI